MDKTKKKLTLGELRPIVYVLLLVACWVIAATYEVAKVQSERESLRSIDADKLPIIQVNEHRIKQRKLTNRYRYLRRQRTKLVNAVK